MGIVSICAGIYIVSIYYLHCRFVQFTASVLLPSWVFIPPRQSVTELEFAGQKVCVCMLVTGLSYIYSLHRTISWNKSVWMYTIHFRNVCRRPHPQLPASKRIWVKTTSCLYRLHCRGTRTIFCMYILRVHLCKTIPWKVVWTIHFRHVRGVCLCTTMYCRYRCVCLVELVRGNHFTSSF